MKIAAESDFSLFAFSFSRKGFFLIRWALPDHLASFDIWNTLRPPLRQTQTAVDGGLLEGVGQAFLLVGFYLLIAFELVSGQHVWQQQTIFGAAFPFHQTVQYILF